MPNRFARFAIPGDSGHKAAFHSVDYFARKHDISIEQARELMRKIGRDREKLNEAATKVFRN
jgi:hypothetical protein